MSFLTIFGKYELGRDIGSVDKGVIWQGTNKHTNEKVAIKLELRRARLPSLEKEHKIYKIINSSQQHNNKNMIGIPNMLEFGTQGDYKAMIMDMLGPSLNMLFKFFNRKLSLKTVLMIGDQMIARIEYLHANNFIHRNITPNNFVFGLHKNSAAANKNQVNNTLYIIDFGHSTNYRHLDTKRHIPYREGCRFIGNQCWAGINVHLGIEQSRRDDVNAAGFVLLYLVNGGLPWLKIRAKNMTTLRNRIGEAKIQYDMLDTCKNIDKATREVFKTYLDYCFKLRFDEKPDYEYLRKLFRDFYFKNGFKDDGIFDWTHLNLSMVCTVVCTKKRNVIDRYNISIFFVMYYTK